jgi:phosphoribosylaminoimidazolecarboxamide formyltransferase/IMP cyclohydrolase
MSAGIKIQRALLSCWNKEGLAELAKELVHWNIEIISSGGTSDYLQDHKIPVTKVEDITGFPSMLEGRVKTLHPYIHGAILAKRTPEHLRQLEKFGVKPIDLVVVNLYPFLQASSQKALNHAEMIEMIDIGGPALLRAAAKNFNYVVPVFHPDQYNILVKTIKEHEGNIPIELSRKFSLEAFYFTAYYDSQISKYFQESEDKQVRPARLSFFYRKKSDLRYGENPHQAAALYGPVTWDQNNHSGPQQLWGKEMSYNNYIDVISAAELVREFQEPTVAIIKHTNPCGIASRDSILEAFGSALAGDPASAYGGIIASNRMIDLDTAQEIQKSFYECIIAPEYSEDTLNVLRKKKNLRILKNMPNIENTAKFEVKFLPFGMLLQDKDIIDLNIKELVSVGAREPGKEEKEDLFFAWRVVKHVKSNAIVYVKNRELVGVGAGQMSRVDAVKLAGLKAKDAGHSLENAVMASDAFFPFRDGIDEAAKAGIRAVIQPGGSIRDQEVIEAAKQHNMAMLFTGIRHFKH